MRAPHEQTMLRVAQAILSMRPQAAQRRYTPGPNARVGRGALGGGAPLIPAPRPPAFGAEGVCRQHGR
jgi:hypothetical protein